MSKQKQKQELNIDLDTIMNPNPKLVQMFKNANAMSISFELGDGEHYQSAEWDGEKRVFFASKSSKVPIKHKLFSLYRKQVGNSSYVYFFDLMTTKDYYMNKVDSTRLCGRWERPEIITRCAINPSSITSDSAMVEPQDFPPEIDGTQTIYEYEFEAVKPQLRKWWESGIIPQTANFYAVIGNNKYGKFTFEEFISLNMEDLELLGKFGNRVKGIYASGENNEKLTALRQMLKEEMKQGLGPKTV